MSWTDETGGTPQGGASVAQIEESLVAVDLELTEERRARPDAAH